MGRAINDGVHIALFPYWIVGQVPWWLANHVPDFSGLEQNLVQIYAGIRANPGEISVYSCPSRSHTSSAFASADHSGFRIDGSARRRPLVGRILT